jgi:hypothetical protein
MGDTGQRKESGRYGKAPPAAGQDGAEGTAKRTNDQALIDVADGEAERLRLTRRRSRRLKPKAAAAPNRGRGPGTAEGDAPQGEPGLATQKLMVSPPPVPVSVHAPIRPDVLKPKSASDLPLNLALLRRGAPETHEDSTPTN